MADLRFNRPTSLVRHQQAYERSAAALPLAGEVLGVDGWAYTVQKATPRYSIAIRVDHQQHGTYVLHWRNDMLAPSMHLRTLQGLFPDVLASVFTMLHQLWDDDTLRTNYGKIPE